MELGAIRFLSTMKEKTATFSGGEGVFLAAETFTACTVYVGLSSNYHTVVIKLIEGKTKEIWSIHLNAINKM